MYCVYRGIRCHSAFPHIFFFFFCPTLFSLVISLVLCGMEAFPAYKNTLSGISYLFSSFFLFSFSPLALAYLFYVCRRLEPQLRRKEFPLRFTYHSTGMRGTEGGGVRLYVRYHCLGGERFWRIDVVWWKGKPVGQWRGRGPVWGGKGGRDVTVRRAGPWDAGVIGFRSG